MNDTVTTDPSRLSKHRIEALTDGIFAVAMTLLVIDLRLPEHGHLGDPAAMAEVLRDLAPNFMSWVISFVVLAIFWISNQRLYSQVRHADGGLLWLTILMLAGASLLPFASAVNSHSLTTIAQTVYASVMILTGLASLFTVRYIYRHPELCVHPMDRETYVATSVRMSGLVVVAALTVPLAALLPGMANFAFLLAFFLRPLGAGVARRWGQVAQPSN
jgi:uncharacterized membrane protein